MEPDIRWIQRLSNLRSALKNLDIALAIENPDVVQRAGMVQFFEMCFELSWNTVKDYLEAQGFGDLKSPRASLKKAFQIGLIQDGATWLKGLEDRNLTSHMYNEEVAREVETMIRDLYAPLIHSLERSLVELSHEES
ncbi:MAG TPA: nucleotidyltransferase substrate binding protein [Rectinemataceae bacterium]|nr:nucleotidyltransferase substrate binding protein [Rectinemataceae bacterium]